MSRPVRAYRPRPTSLGRTRPGRITRMPPLAGGYWLAAEVTR